MCPVVTMSKSNSLGFSPASSAKFTSHSRIVFAPCKSRTSARGLACTTIHISQENLPSQKLFSTYLPISLARIIDITRMGTESPRPSEDICPTGDLILVVSAAEGWWSKLCPESASETKLRVSSTIMSSTSPVLKAMLSGRFLESAATRSAESPQEISLHEDPPQGIGDRCRLLHHSIASIEDKWTAARLYVLMATADRYDCCRSLQLQASASINRHLVQHIHEIQETCLSECDLVGTMAVSYLANDRHNFALVTKRLVMSVNDCFSDLYTWDEGGFLPKTAFRKSQCSYGFNDMLDSVL